MTAREFAKRGAHIVITARNQERAQPVLDEIRTESPQAKVDFIPLELSNFASIRACASTFKALNLPLHILVNNAGLAGAKGLTHEGFEMTFGVNHVGTFLFTQLLLPKLQASAPARIVTVAAAAVVGVGLAIPLLGSLISPAFTRRRRAWVDVGPVDALPVGRPAQLDHVTTVRDGWLEATSHKAVWAVKQL